MGSANSAENKARVEDNCRNSEEVRVLLFKRYFKEHALMLHTVPILVLDVPLEFQLASTVDGFCADLKCSSEWSGAWNPATWRMICFPSNERFDCCIQSGKLTVACAQEIKAKIQAKIRTEIGQK